MSRDIAEKRFLVKDYPILFPGTVNIYTRASIKLVDPAIRLHETKKSIMNLVDKKIFKSIVICDGSNTSIFTESELNDLAESGVNIEQIKFQQNIVEVERFGKSNGECQTVDYAVHNSKIINQAGGFYKLTPRYHFENIENIIVNFKQKNIFYHYNTWPINIRSPFVMTIFYKCSLDFYREIMSGAIDDCSNDVRGYIESVYYRLLKKEKSERIYIEYPFFTGIAGTTGGQISNDYYLLRNYASKFGFLARSYS